MVASGRASQGVKVPSIEEWENASWPRLENLEKIEQGEDWFHVYRVMEGVFAIYEPGHWERVISYLVVGDERAVLFDTGLGIGNIFQVCSELTERKVVVVNSHSHYDHVGGNHAFGAVWAADAGEKRKSVADAYLGIPKERAREYVPEESFRMKPPEGFNRNEYHIKPYRVTRFLRDGEEIDLGGRSVEVILTPGHAPDSLCLFDRANRALYTGDYFYLGPILAGFEDSSIFDYYASARRLAALEPEIEWLLPAHSPPMAEPEWLGCFRDAFRALVEGKVPYEETDSLYGPGRVRNYVFDGFWITTSTTWQRDH
jgi:glyoxylase-like metal-dependent hydrolase (beta-lactamase superfamily II)